MANWDVNNFHAPETINNNKKYEVGDNLSLDAINSAIENSFFRKANEGTAVTKNGVFQSTVDISNEIQGYAQPLAKYPTAEDIDFTQFGENPTLEDFMAYFKANYPKVFKCRIGIAADNKLKNLIGTPPNVGNYTDCIIIPVVYNSGKIGTLYKLIATDNFLSYLGNMATGYLYTLSNNNVSPQTDKTIWVGWENASKTTQEKIEDYAQPIIDNANAVNINNSSLTTLEQYIEYFIENYPKVFSADIGYQETSNFKTLVGTPVDFGNYIKAYISPSTISAQAGNYISFEVRAIGKYTGKVAIGYLRRYWAVGNTSNLYSFTGWEYQTGGNVEHLVTIYDKDSTDATINQGLTSGVDFPNDGTANYVDNCLRSKYKGLYLLFSSESTGANLYVRTYVPLIHSENNRFGFVTPYQGDNTLLYWGNGMWTWDRIALYHLRECYQTTTTVSNSTRYKLVKVEGVLK